MSHRKVGDYGVCDRLTGQFERHGNIYESEDELLVQWTNQPNHQPAKSGDGFIGLIAFELTGKPSMDHFRVAAEVRTPTYNQARET